MHRILTGSISGLLLSLALIAPGTASGAEPPSPASASPAASPLPPRSAASPPSAFVRVEGASTTLLAQTLVQTTTAKQIKGDACPGSSAAGGLDVATHGNWSGSYSPSLKSFFVTQILGEATTGNSYWTLWINGRSSSSGACTTYLHNGDHELWFSCQEDVNFNCTNNPLQLTVAAAARIGRPLIVSVVQLDGSGHGTPIAGAAITGGGLAAVSDVHGKATIIPRDPGLVQLQASKSGATPSDPAFLCFYARRASQCRGSGTAGPAIHVIGIRQHEVLFRGPRKLKGTAGPDPTGLTDVRLGLRRRTSHGKCSYYDATRARWSATKCHARTPTFSVGASPTWSYLLPAPLAPGRYRLEVIARDGAGRTTTLRRDFTVKVAKHPAAHAARAAPAVQIMVAGREHTLLRARAVKLSAASIQIGHRSCAVPAGTALAGLLGAQLPIRVTDKAGCDPSQMFIKRVGGEANHGSAGWEYKIGHSSPSFGAADPGGRLRSGQQLLWFWCRTASACQRTLGIRTKIKGSVLHVHVTGYDDNGHGVAIAGATVHLGSSKLITDKHGRASLRFTPGIHEVVHAYATKPGLVRSFPTAAVIK